MKKVIAYTLYGDESRYTINSIINAEICQKIYPEWECRFYYDKTVSTKIINKLRTYSNVRLINMESCDFPTIHSFHSNKMFWRLLSYDDPEVGVTIFRDTDSFPSERESNAVKQWLETGKSLHLMRETQPGHRSKIMGGMWGIRKNYKIISSIITNILNIPPQNTDQNYLEYAVYPYFENDRVVHDDDNVFGDTTHEWPSKRTPNDEMYIGRTQCPPIPESGQVERYENLEKEIYGI